MAAAPVRRPSYTLFTISAYPENVLASALGIGVKATTMNNRDEREIADGEPLNFWATMGTLPEGCVKTDEEQLEHAFETQTVFLLFRQPVGRNNHTARTLGLARMTGIKGKPYQRPFADWPRTHGNSERFLGSWMKVVPFEVEWYLTCNILDKDLGFQKSQLPAYFVRQESIIIPKIMTKLYAECKSNNSVLKNSGNLHVIQRNLAAFDVLAKTFYFGPRDVWEGEEKVRPKPAARINIDVS
jgi:hypothetical protein